MKTKSYTKVGEITRCEASENEPANPTPPMQTALSDANEVPENWIGVATYNVGVSATVRMMEEAIDRLSK